jgi:phosphoenolpyruvate carboxykinase (GTP)
MPVADELILYNNNYLTMLSNTGVLMTEIPGLATHVTVHAGLLAWVREVAELTQPDRVEWADGSADEWSRITDLLVANGTFTRLDPAKKPNSFWCASDPADVARVEDRTFICSEDEKDAGPTNNWMAPEAMKPLLAERFRGCMRGRTMYVLPYCMGPLSAEVPMLGVEVTDSPYVVASMHIMTRMGSAALAKFGLDEQFVAGLHSVGAPLEPGQQDARWPGNQTKYIVHFPEDRTIWSYGSGYGGNALLGKKCHSLRIASVIARDEGWLAEHMLILKLTSPQQKAYYIAAAFPSSCGKTNLAMLDPTLPGWKVETLGDDIAWIRIGPDGRFYAVNPEFGFFGVAPGTNEKTNPNAIRTLERGNSIFTNVALTGHGDVWWEGLENRPAQAVSWKGADWTPDSGELAAHPNSRYCAPISQCPILAPEFDDPAGVPLDAIFFGGRRRDTIPLITEARDWQHGVFLAATLSSETTAAATGTVGVVRRDPMAMLPFIGYNVGDYLAHWIDVGKQADAAKLPKIFYVNWFRRDADGNFLWPGYRENMRVLKWAIERIEGTAAALDTPIGRVPTADALDLDGLDITDGELAQALALDPLEWRREIDGIEDWFSTLGPLLPASLHDELGSLKRRLDASTGSTTSSPRRPSVSPRPVEDSPLERQP